MTSTPAFCRSEKVTCSFPSPTARVAFSSLVFNSLDMSRSVSVTTAGQCRLAPLIQVILDCSHLYDYTVKLLFKLHSCEYSGPHLLRKEDYSRGCPFWVLSAAASEGLRAPSPLESEERGTSFGVPMEAPGSP